MSEGEVLATEVGELASVGVSTSGSPRRGTKLGAFESTMGSASSSKSDSSASPYVGTWKLKSKPGKTLVALRRKASHPEAHRIHASSLSSAITPFF